LHPNFFLEFNITLPSTSASPIWSLTFMYSNYILIRTSHHLHAC
jgi:hypothetical protein